LTRSWPTTWGSRSATNRVESVINTSSWSSTRSVRHQARNVLPGIKHAIVAEDNPLFRSDGQQRIPQVCIITVSGTECLPPKTRHLDCCSLCLQRQSPLVASRISLVRIPQPNALPCLTAPKRKHLRLEHECISSGCTRQLLKGSPDTFSVGNRSLEVELGDHLHCIQLVYA